MFAILFDHTAYTPGRHVFPKRAAAHLLIASVRGSGPILPAGSADDAAVDSIYPARFGTRQCDDPWASDYGLDLHRNEREHLYLYISGYIYIYIEREREKERERERYK